MGVFKFFLVSLFLVLCSTLAFGASDFYADLIIDIDERGVVSISGLSNHPEVLGVFDNLTSKQGKNWVFELNSDNFSSALFIVSLPKDSVITYIKSSAQISIGFDDSPFVKGILKNKPLEIIVQYHYEESDSKKSLWILFFGIFFLMMGVLVLFFTRKKKEDIFQEVSLTSRQLELLNFLKKKNGVSQSFLEKSLRWPKSSLSRNVASLERKGLIKKINKGNSNVLVLNNKSRE